MSELKSYSEIIDFVQSLPASAPPGIQISRYNFEEEFADPRVEKELNAKDALYIFEKYLMTDIDKRKLIAAILNVKIIG